MLKYEPLFRLEIYSHFFKVINPNPRVSGLLYRFCYKYAQRDWVRERGQKPKLKVTKIYAAMPKGDTIFRFHIGQLDAFYELLSFNHIDESLYVVERAEMFEPYKTDIKIKDWWKPRDKQQEVIDFIIKEDENDRHSRLISLPTGGGKSGVSLYATAKIGHRTMLAILPMYIDKWAGDVTSILHVENDGVMIVRGSAQLKRAIALAKENKITQTHIIISLTTLANYYKAFESGVESIDALDYDCAPEDLCALLGIGNVIVDEAHQHIYAVFRLMLYTHVSKLIALSATFLSMDPFIESIQKLMFPREIRFDEVKMKKYIKVYPMAYNFRNIRGDRVRWTEFGSNSYSHNAFEKSIIKNERLLDNYLAMIGYILRLGYVQDYKEGDKLAIYAGTIEMCTKITEYVRLAFPQYDTRRYVEQDPYENVIEPDIRVTTILSAGTAIDIPNLRTVIMTTCIMSHVANIQSLGRLRELPDRDTKFYYIYSNQIPKQVESHRIRLALYAERAGSIKGWNIPHAI